LYGSSRLGSWYPELIVSAGANDASGTAELWGTTNKKQYELSNHLGNVLATVTDELKSDNTALVMSANDYYPFGTIQPDRSIAWNGKSTFGMIIRDKKSAIFAFMFKNYTKETTGKGIEGGYQLFLQKYMRKDKDGNWIRNKGMWTRDKKGNWTPNNSKKGG
jgi:hypothetical protein